MRRVLVVDDDEDTLRIISQVLSKAGYAVSAGSEGKQALEKARSEKPDAILLDIAMPEMDGLEVLEKLNSEESTASIPVGFLTGRDDREAYERARELGGHIYLMKPVSAEKLVTFVRLLLGEEDA